MADSKWISELDGETRVADAARRVLTVRLKVVHEALPLALHHWTEDPEHVHQLRVGTRRAGAALKIFGLCLPDKVRKKVRNHLRDLRRAAGAARDWDVFGLSMGEREAACTARQRPGFDFLVGYAGGQRVAAQAGIESAGTGAPFESERMIAETLAAVQKPNHSAGADGFGGLARCRLGEMLQDLHDQASARIEHYEQLHQIRIVGKHLRYGMEIFASCFDRSFREDFYPQIEEMQEILGRANDSHVATQRLGLVRNLLRQSQPALWKRVQPGVDLILRYHQRRCNDQRRLFLKWWQRWVKSGSEAALLSLIQAPPH